VVFFFILHCSIKPQSHRQRFGIVSEKSGRKATPSGQLLDLAEHTHKEDDQDKSEGDRPGEPVPGIRPKRTYVHFHRYSPRPFRATESVSGAKGSWLDDSLLLSWG
jgi:hypothetical protein